MEEEEEDEEGGGSRSLGGGGDYGAEGMQDNEDEAGSVWGGRGAGARRYIFIYV